MFNSNLARPNALSCGLSPLKCMILGKATISNDGATIINLLDVVHPAAKTLVDIAKSQDAEVQYCITVLLKKKL